MQWYKTHKYDVHIISEWLRNAIVEETYVGGNVKCVVRSPAVTGHCDGRLIVWELINVNIFWVTTSSHLLTPPHTSWPSHHIWCLPGCLISRRNITSSAFLTTLTLLSLLRAISLSLSLSLYGWTVKLKLSAQLLHLSAPIAGLRTGNVKHWSSGTAVAQLTVRTNITTSDTSDTSDYHWQRYRFSW